MRFVFGRCAVGKFAMLAIWLAFDLGTAAPNPFETQLEPRAQGEIDRRVFAKWQALGIQPATFVRTPSFSAACISM